MSLVSLTEISCNKQQQPNYDDSQMQSPLFKQLPYELLLHIFQFLTPKEITTFQLTCKLAKLWSSDSHLWRSMIKRYFPEFSFAVDKEELKNAVIERQKVLDNIKLGLFNIDKSDIDDKVLRSKNGEESSLHRAIMDGFWIDEDRSNFYKFIISDFNNRQIIQEIFVERDSYFFLNPNREYHYQNKNLILQVNATIEIWKNNSGSFTLKQTIKNDFILNCSYYKDNLLFLGGQKNSHKAVSVWIKNKSDTFIKINTLIDEDDLAGNVHDMLFHNNCLYTKEKFKDIRKWSLSNINDNERGPACDSRDEWGLALLKGACPAIPASMTKL